MGAARYRGQMNKTAEQDCVSPPYVETFNSKLIKRFRAGTRSRYVFSNLVNPMFYAYMFDVYVLPTCHVDFAHGVNCGYST